MKSTRIGAMVTPDAINNFFSLQTAKDPNIKRRVQPTPVRSLGSARRPSSETTLHSNQRQGSDSLSDDYYGTSKSPVNVTEQGDDDAFTPFQFPQSSNASNETTNQLMKLELDDDEINIGQSADSQRNVLDVYKNYSFECTYDPSLPITAYHQNVIDKIESNQVTIVQGSTGSGKTTQVAQYILDHYQSRNKHCNIIVTQPRRIAAISIAKRICHERGWKLGTVVGFQVARDREVTEDTRITLVTTGVLLQKLISNRNMNEYTHVILDEIHERDQDIDFSMLVVRKFLRTVSSHVKVVLMSATLDCSLYARYFSILLNGKLEEAPVVAVEGRMFNIEEFYMNDLTHLGEVPSLDFNEPEIPDKSYHLAKELISHFDEIEMNDQRLQSNNQFAMQRGTVLIFLPESKTSANDTSLVLLLLGILAIDVAMLCTLPGLPEISTMYKFIDNVIDELQLWVLPLHSQITSMEQSRVFERPTNGKRKVILSTNIAESSITVPDIKYVIDFCLVKCSETDAETNYQKLRLSWASQASLTQRKGRAGRVSSGKCYRMITKYFYHDLSPYAVPEMQRCPLEQIILKVKLLDIGHPHETLKHAIQPPEINDIRRTVLLLKEVGALTVMQGGRINPFNGDLTSIGHVMASLPVDVHISKLMIMGHVFGYLEECIVIGAALSLKSIFSRPFKREFESYKSKMDWANWTQSDCIASLSAYKDWKYHKSTKGFGNGGERRWCESKMIQSRMMLEMDALCDELAQRLKKFGLIPRRRIILEHKTLDANDMLVLKIVLCGAFYPNFGISSHIDEEEAEKTMSGMDPFTTVMLQGCPEPGLPYTSAIGRLVRQCGKGKQITFENTRAYVEFDRHPQRLPSPVLPAVYLAIKMRQLRMPLVLYASKEKSDQAKLNWKQMCHLDEVGGLRTERITAPLDIGSSGGNRFSKQPGQIQLDLVPFANILVTEVIDAGHFWAQSAKPEALQRFALLQKTINTDQQLQPFPVAPQTGRFCLAPFQNEYYRAKISALRADSAQVVFLDYGNTDIVHVRDLRQCPDNLLALPFQAFECFLAEIRPVQGIWANIATEKVKSWICDKVFIAKVFSIVRNIMRLHLTIRDVDINSVLIADGLAEVAEESYGSKMVNQSIVNKQRISCSDGSHVSNEESWMEDDGRSMSSTDRVSKVRLRGPYSAYELSFCGLTFQDSHKVSQVERDSVNSVAICEEPQDKHPRLLVSAIVGCNSQGTSLVCRDTTMLPNIHGVCSLIPLLFAPMAELRCDKARTHYTGALCGLGFDPETYAAILPDHDMELTFRVKISQEELLHINSIRICINEFIGSEETLPVRDATVIDRLQNAAKTRVLRLFTTHHEEVVPIDYRRPFRWREVPDDIVINVNEIDNGKPLGHSRTLYMLHNSIILASDIPNHEPAVAKRRQAVIQLCDLAGQSTDPFPVAIDCVLCKVACRHPIGVLQHIRSKMHRKEEAELFGTQHH